MQAGGGLPKGLKQVGGALFGNASCTDCSLQGACSFHVPCFGEGKRLTSMNILEAKKLLVSQGT